MRIFHGLFCIYFSNLCFHLENESHISACRIYQGGLLVSSYLEPLGMDK